MADNNSTVAAQLSELASMLRNLNDNVNRVVWRLDQYEGKVNTLEQRVVAIEIQRDTYMQTKQNAFSTKAASNAGYVVVGILLTYVAKQLGLV